MRTKIRRIFIVMTISLFTFDLPITTNANAFSSLAKGAAKTSIKRGFFSGCTKATNDAAKVPNYSRGVGVATKNRILNNNETEQ